MQLDETVMDLIWRHKFDTFGRYWEIYKKTALISDVSAAHIVAKPEEGYLNVAIVGDGLLVDIEGEDHPSQGELSVDQIGAISGISVNVGSLAGFPKSQGASLVVVTRLRGAPNAGPYWAAWTPAEETSLMEFARSLTDGFSALQIAR